MTGKQARPPRHGLRHPGRWLGRRGTFLLAFAVVWMVIGLSSILVPTTVLNQSLFYENLPDIVRSGMWLLAGVLAFAAAFLRRPGWDVIGFVALSLPAAIRGVSYLGGWVVYLTDVGPGSAFGWSGFVVYAAIVVAIMIVASWPEPPLAMIAPGPPGGGGDE